MRRKYLSDSFSTVVEVRGEHSQEFRGGLQIELTASGEMLVNWKWGDILSRGACRRLEDVVG